MSSTASTFDTALAAPATPSGRAATIRALSGVMRLEWRRQLLTFRVLWPLALAALPLAISGTMAWFVMHFPENFQGHGTHGTLAGEYANLYHVLIVRVVLFFGCLSLFLNLVRGEVEERTFHYLLLTPVPRPLIVAAKYVAAVGSSALLFSATTIGSFLLMRLPEGISSAFTGPALSELGAYLAMTLLGCMGYGGFFLLLGSLLRSPGPLVALYFLWEWAEFLLPPILKQVSVVHYLKALTPVPADH